MSMGSLSEFFVPFEFERQNMQLVRIGIIPGSAESRITYHGGMREELDRTELDAYFALVVAADLVQRALTAQLAEHGLTPVKFTILSQLLEAPDGIRMRELASQLVHSRSGLTYQVTQLERAGLVRRIASSEDERGVLAVLTDAGAERVRQAFPGHLALVRAVFFDSLPEGGAAALRELLEPVVHGLRAASEPTGAVQVS